MELPITARDYKKFFTTGGRMPCLNVSFILGGSHGMGNLFITSRSDAADVFVNKEKEKVCLAYGVDLYGSKERYDAYMTEFKNYIAEAKQTFIPKYKTLQTFADKAAFEKDLAFIAKMWDLYGTLEFYFMDQAYEVAQRDQNTQMLERLEEAGRFKLEAREILNAYFFADGVLVNFRKSVGAQFNYPHHDCLYAHEMLALFDGVRLLEETAQERKECYAAMVVDGEITYFDFEVAKALNAAFTRVDESLLLKGVVANKGVARGRAIVVPMMEDHTKIVQIDARMQQGDILIAESTSPDIMMLCKKAAAIVANQGGMLSHAAVVSRELGIPCIVRTERATEIIKDGDLVEVDADKGVVRIL